MPGEYTATLHVNDKTLTTKIQVRADPRVAVTVAELQEQHDVALAIRDLTSRANTLLEQTDGMARQLTSINQTLRPGVGANGARGDSAIAVQQGAAALVVLERIPVILQCIQHEGRS